MRRAIEDHDRAGRRQRVREHDELHRERLREFEKVDAAVLAPWRAEIAGAHLDSEVMVTCDPEVVPPFVDSIALDAAHEIEDALATEYPGGAAQRRAVVQGIVAGAILAALGEVE